jgi:hypothetical protein
MFKLPDFSSRLAAVCVFVASYLPPLVGFVYGVGHCETCRQAWIKLVWIVQGALIPLFFKNLLRLSLPPADQAWGIALAIAVQIAWLAGWTWLASRGKVWLAFSIAVVFGLSIWFAYVMHALIRM